MAALNASEARPNTERTGGSATKSPFNILVAYDGSEEAQAAVALVADRFKSCADAQSCRLSLMTVLPTQYFGQHENLEKSLTRQREAVLSLGIPAEVVLKTGNPAPSLIFHASEIGANMIVMGARGLRSTFGILLGGVAQQIVEHAEIPVLIVRAPYTGIRRALVVVDGSEFSRKAVDYLAPECTADQIESHRRIHGTSIDAGETGPKRDRCSWLPVDCQITALHVMQPDLSPEMAARAWTLGPEILYPAPLSPADIAEMQRREEAQAHTLLQEVQSVINSAGLETKTMLKRGDAASEILETARAQKTDLIVCGSRGLNPIAGWLLGSVSRKLVHYAPCSVLVVK